MRHINPRITRQVRALTAAALVLLAACDCSSTTAPPDYRTVNGTIVAPFGHEVDVTLQTVGPGEFVAPPTISSPVIRYLTVTEVSPAVPAGPTQRFQFAIISRGVAIVTFQHTQMPRTVVDTIVVQ